MMLPLRFSFVVSGAVLDFVIKSFHAILEALDTFAKTFHQFWNLLASEEQQHNEGNENDFGSS